MQEMTKMQLNRRAGGRAALLSAALLMALLPAPAAWAEGEASEADAAGSDADRGEWFWGRKRSVRVLQRRAFSKSKRLEVAVIGGMIPNDPFVLYSALGIRVSYFVAESLSIGATVVKPFAHATGLGSQIFDEYEQKFDSRKNLHQALFYHINVLEWTPLYGKLSLLGLHILHFDAGISGGFGLLHSAAKLVTFRGTEAEDETDIKALFTFGVGARFYLNDWMAVRADIQQYFYPKPKTLGGISHPTMLSLGFSAFLPGFGGGGQ